MGRRDVPCLWVEPPFGFRYLTGLEPIAMERLTGLVIGPVGDLRLVVPDMLADECSAIDAESHTWNDQEGPEGAAATALKGIDRLYIQPSLPAWAWNTLRTSALECAIEIDPGVLARLREIKDEQEVDALRCSARIADEMT